MIGSWRTGKIRAEGARAIPRGLFVATVPQGLQESEVRGGTRTVDAEYEGKSHAGATRCMSI